MNSQEIRAAWSKPLPEAERNARLDIAVLLAELDKVTAERNRYAHYCTMYGNMDSKCAYGYPQQRGLICALCKHDNSDGSPCPKGVSTVTTIAGGELAELTN